VSLAVIVNLIGATRTAAGLRVRCELDRGAYPKGQDVSDAQMATLALAPHRFHGDWNYTFHPIRDDDSFTYCLTLPNGKVALGAGAKLMRERSPRSIHRLMWCSSTPDSSSYQSSRNSRLPCQCSMSDLFAMLT